MFFFSNIAVAIGPCSGTTAGCYTWGSNNPFYEGYCCQSYNYRFTETEGELDAVKIAGNCGDLFDVEVGPLGDLVCGDMISHDSCGGPYASGWCN